MKRRLGSYSGYKGGRKLQGGWIQLAAAAVGAAASFFGGRSASRQARRDAAEERALRGRELRLAEAQDARGAKLFEEYEQTYLPREREFVESAFSDETSPEAAASRAVTDVRTATDTGRQIRLRDARRLGVNPTSGAYAALDNQSALGDAALEVTAKDSARRTARDDNFQRQYTSLSLGRNLPSAAGALTGNAQRGIGGLADAAGRRTDQSNALAAQAGDAFGRSLSNLTLAAYDQFGKKPAGTRVDMPVSGPGYSTPGYGDVLNEDRRLNA
jgi:hypothetical protein